MRRIRPLTVAGSLFIMVAIGLSPILGKAQESASISMLGGNAARTGEQPGPAPQGRPVLLWSNEVGTVTATPVFQSGIVFAMVSSSILVALDAASGREVWRFALGESGREVQATEPTVADGVVYIGGSEVLHAIDAATGGELWRFRAEEETRFQSPAVVNGVVYSGGGRMFYAIDAALGTELWSHRAQAWLRSSATFADDTLFIVDEGGLLALEAATGNELWHFESEGSGVRFPVVSGEAVYFSSSEALYALDKVRGDEIWDEDYSTSSVAVWDDSLVVGRLDGTLHALDRETGTVRWTTQADGSLSSQPVVAGGAVYVSTLGEFRTGLLSAFDANTGEDLWHFDLPTASVLGSGPAIVDGVIFVGLLSTPFVSGALVAITGDSSPLPPGEGITEGGRVVVSSPMANLRAAPSTSAVIVEELAAGTELIVTGPSEEREGYVWWSVENPATGARGYVAAELLTAL